MLLIRYLTHRCLFVNVKTFMRRNDDIQMTGAMLCCMWGLLCPTCADRLVGRPKPGGQSQRNDGLLRERRLRLSFVFVDLTMKSHSFKMLMHVL